MKYGRCMSKEDARGLKRTGILMDHGSGSVPVFDSPGYVEKRIMGMGRDRLKNYFRDIGVRDANTVVFFETNLRDGIVGPIGQKNGLREYKIPAGTRVNVYGLIPV